MIPHPHRRYNPLRDEWILVSPHRTQRPWQGRRESVAAPEILAHDPACPLCPGNTRGNGQRNPDYQGVFAFDNDFPALLKESPEANLNTQDLLIAKSETGICRVMCYSPRHDLTLARLDPDAIRRVVAAWIEEFVRLDGTPGINHVQIFENKGVAMGASNPHPHCQIWANASIPMETAREIRALKNYHQAKHTCLLCDYLELELKLNQRIVELNDSFAVVVPFWAAWPFETLLLARRHLADLSQLLPKEQHDLALILKKLAIRYDNLFATDFPYSMGFHQRPSDGGGYPELHLHAHFYPPLLRSASVRKFMVGYEMLAETQRDITPEAAAQELCRLSERHYTEGQSTPRS